MAWIVLEHQQHKIPIATTNSYTKQFVSSIKLKWCYAIRFFISQLLFTYLFAFAFPLSFQYILYLSQSCIVEIVERRLQGLCALSMLKISLCQILHIYCINACRFAVNCICYCHRHHYYSAANFKTMTKPMIETFLINSNFCCKYYTRPDRSFSIEAAPFWERESFNYSYNVKLWIFQLLSWHKSLFRRKYYEIASVPNLISV